MTPRRVKDVLWVLAIFGFVTVVNRLTSGLGGSTDLSDGVPWGIWKVVNMVAGVALATGGFTLAFAVHVAGRRSLLPLVRLAVLVAFLGYGSSCLALLMDIGLPWRFWHPFLFWNGHSFLFEVFWCVSLYFTVTVIELAPVALEGSKFESLGRRLEKIALPVVVLGITFSTLHHSSLGSLFLVSPATLHPFWYSPLLPAHFIVTAIGGGLLTVVLLSIGVARLYRRVLDTGILTRAAVAAAIILGIGLLLRIGDLTGRGLLGDALSGSSASLLFLLEATLLFVAPIAILMVPAARRSRGGLVAAGLCAAAGVVLNRLDTGVFGYLLVSGATYHPPLAEIALTLGIPASAGLVFLAFVERFRVFPPGEPLVDPCLARSDTDFDRQTLVWKGAFLDPVERVSLFIVIVVPIAVAFATGRAEAEPPRMVEPPRALDTARHVLEIDGDRDRETVRFDHEDHRARLGGEESCAKCHHLDFPGDRYPSCHRCHSRMTAPSSIFDHVLHQERLAAREELPGPKPENRTCGLCHPEDRPRTGETAKHCVACHEEDMRLPEKTEGDPAVAPGYVDAMHSGCVGCHTRDAERVGRPDLPECATCHRR